jgi:lipopolysaccharide/colanic/teichoic acid biosynthesis glycosyltransferase
MEYLPRYSDHHRRRHEVRPGLTGLAQVNGRQGLPFSRRLDLDVWYIDHWSLWLDLKILFLTIPRVLGLSGVVDEQRLDALDDIGLTVDLGGHSRT